MQLFGCVLIPETSLPECYLAASGSEMGCPCWCTVLSCKALKGNSCNPGDLINLVINVYRFKRVLVVFYVPFVRTICPFIGIQYLNPKV